MRKEKPNPLKRVVACELERCLHLRMAASPARTKRPTASKVQVPSQRSVAKPAPMSALWPTGGSKVGNSEEQLLQSRIFRQWSMVGQA
jgi:hypothetical protein